MPPDSPLPVPSTDTPAPTIEKRRGRPPKAEADRFSEEFMMRMTGTQMAFVRREARRRKTTVAGVIRVCVGFLERAAAEKARLLDWYQRNGWDHLYEEHRRYQVELGMDLFPRRPSDENV